MEDRSFYVYAHYRLDTMEPFYIGKGKNGRANKIERNDFHDNVSEKHGHAVVILYDNLTEEEAFFYEREIIEDLVFDEGYEIDCNGIELTKKYSYLTNFTFGGEGATGHNPYKNKNEEEIKLINEKKSISKKGNKNPFFEKSTHNSKKCYCKELDLYFESVSIASEYCKEILNVNAGSILLACKKTINSSGVYNGLRLHWEFTDNDFDLINLKKIKKLKKELNNTNIIKQKNQNNTKPCYCPELNLCFSSCKIGDEYCRKILNIKTKGCCYVCNGSRISSGNYNGKKLHWIYTENMDKKIIENVELIDLNKYEELLSQNVNDCK